MFLSIDIEKTKSHIDIVSEELYLSQTITALLSKMAHSSQISSTDDMGFVSRQLELAKKQEQYLQDRLSALETVIHKANSLLRYSEEKLNEQLASREEEMYMS